MEGQDWLEQMGSDLSLRESMVQDDTPMQEDISPQPNPEVVMGAGGAAYERPLHQISPQVHARPRRIGFVRVVGHGPVSGDARTHDGYEVAKHGKLHGAQNGRKCATDGSECAGTER